MGRSTVERDGVSVAHAARFVLVGTMNPEEGELRPQLLDRFGLTVEVAAPRDPALRVGGGPPPAGLRRRPGRASWPRFADQEERPARRGSRPRRSGWTGCELADWALIKIAEVCAAFEVDGMRADIVTARAAVAHAAWHGRTEVTRADIRAAARLALPHRRRRNPFDAPGLDEDLLDRLLGDDDLEPEPEPEPTGADPARTPRTRRRTTDAGGHRRADHAARGRRDGPDRRRTQRQHRPGRRRGSARRAARRTRAGRASRRRGSRTAPGCSPSAAPARARPAAGVGR